MITSVVCILLLSSPQSSAILTALTPFTYQFHTDHNVDVALELIENGFAVADNYHSVIVPQPDKENSSSTSQVSPPDQKNQNQTETKDVDKKVEDVKEAAPVTNGNQHVPKQKGSEEGNNNGDVKLFDNFEKFANKSWNELVEEDESDYAGYSH